MLGPDQFPREEYKKQYRTNSVGQKSSSDMPNYFKIKAISQADELIVEPSNKKNQTSFTHSREFPRALMSTHGIYNQNTYENPGLYVKQLRNQDKLNLIKLRPDSPSKLITIQDQYYLHFNPIVSQCQVYPKMQDPNQELQTNTNTFKALMNTQNPFHKNSGISGQFVNKNNLMNVYGPLCSHERYIENSSFFDTYSNDQNQDKSKIKVLTSQNYDSNQVTYNNILKSLQNTKHKKQKNQSSRFLKIPQNSRQNLLDQIDESSEQFQNTAFDLNQTNHFSQNYTNMPNNSYNLKQINKQINETISQNFSLQSNFIQLLDQSYNDAIDKSYLPIQTKPPIQGRQYYNSLKKKTLKDFVAEKQNDIMNQPFYDLTNNQKKTLEQKKNIIRVLRSKSVIPASKRNPNESYIDKGNLNFDNEQDQLDKFVNEIQIQKQGIDFQVQLRRQLDKDIQTFKNIETKLQ